MTAGPPWPPAMPERPEDQFPSSEATPARPGAGVIRPIPAGTDGPSFDAIAMKSVLSRARDSTRFEAPEIEHDDGEPRKFPFKPLLVTLVSMLVVGMLAGFVYVRFFREVAEDPTTQVITTQEAERPEVSTPQEAARGYLEALAAGDVETALSFGELGGQGSEVLLTPEAYAAMPPEARPQDISILTEDPQATQVAVQYTINGEQVNTTFQLDRSDSGSYSLRRTTVTILFQVPSGENLPMFINGVEVNHAAPIEVVPGSYALSTGLPFVAFPTEPQTIQSLAYTDTPVFPVTPSLTASGQEALLTAARSSLDRCIASTELTPTGCPNAIRAPREIVPGSVRWRLTTDPWQGVTPTLYSEDQTVATATLNLSYRVSMSFTDGRTSGNTDLNKNVAIRAVMTGQAASDVSVTWGN